MNRFVTDTQAIIKFMTGKTVFNARIHQLFLEADSGDSVIVIPAVVMMEILYLFEKKRIDVSILHIDELLLSPNYHFEPLSLEILKSAAEIDDIPELHDRLIAATARFLDLPLITNDPVIARSSAVHVLQ